MAQTSDGIRAMFRTRWSTALSGSLPLARSAPAWCTRPHRARAAVDIPMFETMAGFVMGDHRAAHLRAAARQRRLRPHLSRDRRPYKTSDAILRDRYNDKQWESFFKATGRDDLAPKSQIRDHSGRATNFDAVVCRTCPHLPDANYGDMGGVAEKADVPVMPMHDLGKHLVGPAYW